MFSRSTKAAVKALAGIARGLAPQADVLTRSAARQEVAALLASPAFAAPERLEHAGARVFSMHGQDGILQEIFARIGTTDRRFVEFGAQTGTQCNARLLLWLGWTGLWIEGDPASARRLREGHGEALASGRLRFAEAFVTAENIDALLAQGGVGGSLDLLVIDIDGNDMHVFNAISTIRPRVVCIEYNASFPPPIDLVVPYDPAFRWDGTLWFGASLAAMARVLGAKGYVLVGTDVCGADAFFVREDLVGERFWRAGDVAALYNPPRFALELGFPTGHPAPEGDPPGRAASLP